MFYKFKWHLFSDTLECELWALSNSSHDLSGNLKLCGIYVIQLLYYELFTL